MTSPFPLTRGLKALLIATGVVFLLQLLPWTGGALTAFGELIPFQTFCRGEVWRLVTYMFLHSTTNGFHLVFNMLALWMFGGELEAMWGTRKFVALYFLFGIGAALFSLIYLASPVLAFTPIIGASGAIFGLLTAYAVYYPQRELLLFFILPVKAWMLVAGYAAISLFFAFTQGSGVGGGVAHLVHLGGIVVAFGYLKLSPRVDDWRRKSTELRDECAMRRRAEKAAERKRYFTEQVDPILEKIARQGMESLTAEERKMLEKAGRESKDHLLRKKVIPLDLFRKKGQRDKGTKG